MSSARKPDEQTILVEGRCDKIAFQDADNRQAYIVSTTFASLSEWV